MGLQSWTTLYQRSSFGTRFRVRFYPARSTLGTGSLQSRKYIQHPATRLNGCRLPATGYRWDVAQVKWVHANKDLGES